ncbi:MerR family transcriptional regulator [Streptomyces sp. NPDC093109]|uniref:DNA polymerase III subunit beta family protein n=1 Tax=Streptomyces sp. NPDC093109 TaxID=3154977 RepID=UPI00345071CE
MESTTDSTSGTNGTSGTSGGSGGSGRPSGGVPVDLVFGAPELLGISAFARRVGLAPSALRFYDDCQVLPPARVDATTGYRFYSADQQIRANMLRSLREAGLPLADVTVVLDGEVPEARAVLERHRTTVQNRSRAADATIAAVLRSMPGPGDGDRVGDDEAADPTTRVRLGGAELAAAVRQVAPAAARSAEFPVLGCVLVEIDEDEVRLVATDRYRLSVRGLKPVLTVEGPPRRLLVDAERLAGIGTWAARCAAVTIEAGPGGAAAHDTDGPRETAEEKAEATGEGSREIPLTEGEFPAYREMLTALPPRRHRVIVDRAALIAAVGDCGDGSGDGSAENVDARAVALRLGKDEVTVSRPDGTRATALPAVRLGEETPRIGFDPAVLVPALEASVGPDVLLEISGATEPVVVRSADQGSFTTLVMPVALPADPTTEETGPTAEESRA